jgi:hypothetical protein
MSQAQPDLVLYRPGIWRGRHPGPADISLLIEISDSTLAFDLGGKLGQLLTTPRSGICGSPRATGPRSEE